MDSQLTDTEVPTPINNITASMVSRSSFVLRFFRPASYAIRSASVRSVWVS
jgi:hypothetical protein